MPRIIHKFARNQKSGHLGLKAKIRIRRLREIRLII